MSTPSTAFLDELHALTERRRAAFVPLTSAFPGADEPSRASVRAAAKAGEADVLDVAHAIHAHPEEAFREVRSVAAIADLLRGHGVPAAVGTHGLSTALRAGLTATGPDDGDVSGTNEARRRSVSACNSSRKAVEGTLIRRVLPWAARRPSTPGSLPRRAPRW